MAKSNVPAVPAFPQLPENLEALRPALEAFAKAAYHSDQAYRQVRSTIKIIHEHAPNFADVLASLLVVIAEQNECIDSAASDLLEIAQEEPDGYIIAPRAMIPGPAQQKG